MTIITSIVGDPEHHRIDWPETLPLPREDDEVELPWGPVWVRHIVWYPLGNPQEGETEEPFVYLVLGPRRP